MITRLDRYLSNQMLVPMLGSLAVALMLLLLERMLRLFDFVISEGGPISVVWRMLGNLIPLYLGLGVPLSLLIGVMLAFRKLALRSELDAVLAAPYSYLRMLRVPMLYAGLLAVLTFILVGYIQPYSQYAFEGLRFELRTGALGASIKVGEFNSMGKGVTLRVDQSLHGGSDLRGVFLHLRKSGGEHLVVTARQGRFLATDDPDILILRLLDGRLSSQKRSGADQRLLTFSMHDLPIDLPKIAAFRARGGRERELTLPELWQAQDTSGQQGLTWQQSAANLHRRLIQIAVLFLLPPLGLALAIPPKRNAGGVGIFLGIALLIIYNQISQATERASALGHLHPVAAQWLPFAAFGLLSGWLFYRLAYRVESSPAAQIERLASRLARAIGSGLRRLRPRRATWIEG